MSSLSKKAIQRPLALFSALLRVIAAPLFRILHSYLIRLSSSTSGAITLSVPSVEQSS